MRVLQITPYPTDNPRHGGQFRALNTKRVLKDAGIHVEHLAVFRKSYYPDYTPDVDITATASEPYSRYPQLADFAAGIALASNKRLCAKLGEALSSLQFDVVMLEEPWLWHALRNAGINTVPIIYNAYNIESEVKRAILLDIKAPAADYVAMEIQTLEKSLCQAAAGCTAVTMSDAEVLATWTSGQVVVARNGTSKRKLNHLVDVLPTSLSRHDRYVLFVGSAHPPNITGFCDIVKDALVHLRSGERIVVAGSVCMPIIEQSRTWEAAFMMRDRLALLGEVTEHTLSALLANAVGIILPVRYGGGSNLKTAEALVAGLPIVGTEHAFRGYEQFMNNPGVMIANDSASFAVGIRRLFDGGLPKSQPSAAMDALLWKNTLQPLIGLIEQVAVQK